MVLLPSVGDRISLTLVMSSILGAAGSQLDARHSTSGTQASWEVRTAGPGAIGAPSTVLGNLL